MLHEVLQRVVLSRSAEALHAADVHPVDLPVASSGKAGAARVLLVGSGVTTGWGVRTYGLALVGALQRTLQARLGRPVDVEQLSRRGAVVADAVDLIGDRAGEDWDVIVLAFGIGDALRMTSPSEWRRSLELLLAELDDAMPPGLLVPIVLAGIPPIGSLALVEDLLVPVIARHAQRLDAATTTVAEHNRRAVFAPLPPMAAKSERPQGSPGAYEAWASALADAIKPLMPADVSRLTEDSLVDLPGTAPVVAVLDRRHADTRAALQRIAREARAATGASFALVNLLAGDHLVGVASSGSDVVRLSRVSAAFGEVTMRAGELHVPDACFNPRFRSLAIVRLHGVRAYAGVALRTPDGEVLGTLCAYDGDVSGPLDLGVLRRLADRAEDELGALLAGGAAPVRMRAPRTQAVPVRIPERTSVEPPTEEPADLEPPRSTASRVLLALQRPVRLRVQGRRLTETATRASAPEEREVRIAGPDPLRILVVGGEYSVGFGARTRDEALDGVLARLLHTRTGRGVVVENRSRHLVPLEQLATSLGPAGARGFDVVVWTPTFVEAAKTLLRARWIAGLGAMLHRIAMTSDAVVVLVGFPMLIGTQPLAVVGRARARQINRLLRWIARQGSQVHVADPPAIELGRVEQADGAAVYHAAAVRILPTVMRLLDGEDEDRATPAERRAPARGLLPEVVGV